MENCYTSKKWSRITLVDKKEDDKFEKNKIGDSNKEVISDDLDVAITLNECFQNAMTKLGITECSDNFGTNTVTLGDPVGIPLFSFFFFSSFFYSFLKILYKMKP